MHLLNARQATTDDDGEAIDLGQSRGDIVYISAADTELRCLATVQAARPAGAPSLRLANMLRLTHPMSVDLYVETVVAGADLVVLRMLGGRSYWPYGLEQIAAACRSKDIPLAVLPGDDQPDQELAAWCTLPADVCHRLWQYGVHGGLANGAALLRYAASLLGRDESWTEPAPLMRAGIYWPGETAPDLETLRRSHWRDDRPVAAVVFYRALVQAADLEVIDTLVNALDSAQLNALPLYVTSLKDKSVASLVGELLDEADASAVLNATGFAISKPNAPAPTPLDGGERIVLQMVFSGGGEAAWAEGTRGLSARDLAMNVVLPEIDGRVLSRAVAFKEKQRFDERSEIDVVGFKPVQDRLDYTAQLARAWIELRNARVEQRRIAIVLANYPNRDGRIANGVGLDTPESAADVLDALQSAGYALGSWCGNGQTLVDKLVAGVTNNLAKYREKSSEITLSISGYKLFFKGLPEDVQVSAEKRWGAPENDPQAFHNVFKLALLQFGNIVVGIQPARGYNIDPVSSYHDPDLVPPHHYFAFYAWLRQVFGVHAIVHLGKHGNLEWLPGKALALSEACFPEAALGPLPHLYPFIVNDPGEGSQAKRRTSAVIIDHLTPPMTRAESYGPFAELEGLVDEYYQAAGVDARRVTYLRGEILAESRRLGLDKDLGVDGNGDPDDALAKLDNHLCEIKELQIRDGLHILGRAPVGDQLTDLLVALVRVPRGDGLGGNASILRALFGDLRLGGIDPLDCDFSEAWHGPKPETLASQPGAGSTTWRSVGDTVERLELLARALVAGERPADRRWTETLLVLREIDQRIRPAILASGRDEIENLLAGLDGRFVPPGAAGAPTRGRLDVLPTGRNFFSVDCRAVPTPAAWHLGRKSAEMLIERYLQDEGDWPKTVVLSAWGTANMRTGGDDIAQALALIGAKPVWDQASHRVTGIEVLPVGLLDRPRVDVTLRVSGFFRDAFPAQIELFDKAVREVAATDEPPHLNPIRARIDEDKARLIRDGHDPVTAGRRAAFRVFGSKPGAYGAGLQALIDERGWETDEDLAKAYVAWGGYAYGAKTEGEAEHGLFERRLQAVELVLHNQDNREHDILDSDDYYQFEGGVAATVRHLSGEQPSIYHNDHSRPESPRIRTLKEEIGRVVRGRAANPKWLKGVMRHGYKGAFEIAATVDYLFAFAATARVVEDHHFDALYDAYLVDDEVRDFIERHNPDALEEIARRFQEAIERGLWRPRANDAHDRLGGIAT
ncbi:MAG: cobaltochelatase subunit CobN [Alphaproteobacteria bacterium]|nr:cobaltochelatase subunit CobN [Alphaproteobacteria bacterium]